MKREDLANEIRGAGMALRYADGPVTVTSFRGSKTISHHSAVNKLKMPDELIVTMAATCSTCDAVASKMDIELAEEWADCYQAYARLIWPCIDHEEWCFGEPYIPVSKSASRRFRKIKEKFDAKRKARADAKAKMTPDELKARLEARREAGLKRKNAASATDLRSYIEARREARLKRKNDPAATMKKVANKGMQEPGKKKAPVSKAKKSKPAKKASSVKKKTSPKKPSGKKPPKRKKR
ncbi:MAG: hypothetical protein WCJ41_21530 [Aestuariivirga sp.]|uniref:hypothetical protein n=1 Tax=Aestuariivirga sp. TaxID=2650926 RepID=UPI003019E314